MTTPHPGTIIRAIIEANNLTVSGVAKAIKMDRASFTLVLQGRYNVSRDLCLKLDRHLGREAGKRIIEASRAYEDATYYADRQAHRLIPERAEPTILPTTDALTREDMLTRLACVSAMFFEGDALASDNLDLIHRIVSHPDIDDASGDYLLGETARTDVDRIRAMFPGHDRKPDPTQGRQKWNVQTLHNEFRDVCENTVVPTTDGAMWGLYGLHNTRAPEYLVKRLKDMTFEQWIAAAKDYDRRWSEAIA